MRYLKGILFVLSRVLGLFFLPKARLGFLWDAQKYRRKYPNGSLQIIGSESDSLNADIINDEDVALFIVWMPQHHLMYQRYFELLERLNFKVIVIVNGGEITDDFLSYFKQKALTIFTRDNMGRDFGAYKECIKYFKSNNLKPRRLLLCNDSVFADMLPNDKRFENFIRSNAEAHFVGAAEYFGKPDYHVQSYFLILSKRVLNAPSFQKFWDDFLISNDRRLNIHNGEIALTKAILKDGFKPKVFLSTDALLQSISLSNGSAADVLSDMVLNKHILAKYHLELEGLKKTFDNYIELDYLEKMGNSIIDSPNAKINRSFNFGKFSGGLGGMQENITPIASNESLMMPMLHQRRVLLEGAFSSSIAPIINGHGALTSCPFANIRIHGFPFLKRDLVYRQVTEWMLIRERSKDFDPYLLDEYIEDQRLKKRHWHLKWGKERWLYDIGMN